MTKEECDDAISRADAIGLFKDDVAAVNELMQLESVHPKVCECEDTISRQAALDAIDTWDKFGVDDTNSLFRLDNLSLPNYVPYIHYDDVIKCIKGMPSVTPKQKMGRWLQVDYEEPIAYDCSECGAMVSRRYRYCPECGAKMQEDIV